MDNALDRAKDGQSTGMPNTPACGSACSRPRCATKVRIINYKASNTFGPNQATESRCAFEYDERDSTKLQLVCRGEAADFLHRRLHI